MPKRLGIRSGVMNAKFNVGSKLRWNTTNSDGSMISFSVRVVRAEPAKEAVWIEFPERARNLPFPPNHGKRFALFRVADLEKWYR